MPKHLHKILVFTLLYTFTFFEYGYAIPSPDSAPKFGKVILNFTDSNSTNAKEMIYRLDTFYATQVAKGFNGSVLIGYKGKIIYERYFGIANKELNTFWNKETQSQLASTSKPFTGAAIMILKDKGLLKFDDYVTQYIPNFPYSDITLRMLLDHRSGLPDYIHFAAKSPLKPFLDNDDVLHIFETKKPKQLFATNTKFKYSNSNYAILASIVESISGMKFDLFMKKYVFGPLKMENTKVIDPTIYRSENMASCYRSNWKLYADMHLDGVAGDKGVYSCVQDLYKWDQALYTNKFIKQSTLKEAYTPYSFEKTEIRNYGLAWRMLNYPDGMKIIYHNGNWHGNNTSFYRFIEDNFTIIVLGNRTNGRIYHQPLAIYNILMNVSDSTKEVETDE
jgi:CubicO group peptidase (beta-lactamase class C family)